MPNDEVFDKKIYDFNDPPNDKGNFYNLFNPFYALNSYVCSAK